MGQKEHINCTDKAGQHFAIGIYDTADLASLLDMYAAFSPKPASQGLPPKDIEMCYSWVRGLVRIGTNFLAWKGERVIGHAALIPDARGKSGEFVIFVDEASRNLGVGSELTRLAVEKARQMGFESIWLTVESSNFMAMRLYRKIGFEFSDMDFYERTMTIKI
ncbi:MAG: GNAT family N-acetyltransferase [Dissulfurispiraceae bacterium]